MLVGKEDVFTWLLEKLLGKAMMHYFPKWFGVAGVGILIILAVVGIVMKAYDLDAAKAKAQLPEVAKPAAPSGVGPSPVGEFIGRVVLSLLFAVLGGFCGGVAWGILARNFALVEGVGGPDGPGIAAMTTAAITAVVSFATYSRWSRPARSRS